MRNRWLCLIFLHAAASLSWAHAAHSQTIEPHPDAAPAVRLEAPAPPEPLPPYESDEANDQPGVTGSAGPLDQDDVIPPAWLQEVNESAPAHPPPPNVVPPDATTERPTQAGTTTGAMGVFRIASAGSAHVNQLSLQLTAEFAKGSDVIIRGDQNTRLASLLSASYGFRQGLELYGAYAASSNRNRRVCLNGAEPCLSEPDRSDPELIRLFGDVLFGAKLSRRTSPSTHVAAYSQIKFFSSAEDVFIDFSATSFAVGGLGTWDGAEHRRVPLRLHAQVGYYIDHSAHLHRSANVSPSSQLVTAYAYGLGRSRFQMGLAAEVTPAKVGRAVSVWPFLEYRLDIVTGRADSQSRAFWERDCLSSGRLCQDHRDQQWLTLGGRAALPEQWQAAVSVDIGFRSFGEAYGPPQAPFGVAVQAGRLFDLGPSSPSSAPAAAVTPNDVEDGVIVGTVKNADTNEPVECAVVAVEGRAHARVASDSDGSFTTHDLEPGVYDLTITALGFQPQSIRAKVGQSMATDIEVLLVRRPQGQARGRIVDLKGAGLVAQVRFVGGRNVTAHTDGAGHFEVALDPGSYVARVEAEGHLMKDQRLNIEPGGQGEVNFVLRPRNVVAAAELREGTHMSVRLPVTFESQAGGWPVVLTAQTLQILDEIVDILVMQPRVRRLVIETHWDAGGSKIDPLALTVQQAGAIADYLRAQGVAEDRIEVAPRGASIALVPNQGKNRTRNRRVVFSVIADEAK